MTLPKMEEIHKLLKRGSPHLLFPTQRPEQFLTICNRCLIGTGWRPVFQVFNWLLRAAAPTCPVGGPPSWPSGLLPGSQDGRHCEYSTSSSPGQGLPQAGWEKPALASPDSRGAITALVHCQAHFGSRNQSCKSYTTILCPRKSKV